MLFKPKVSNFRQEDFNTHLLLTDYGTNSSYITLPIQNNDGGKHTQFISEDRSVEQDIKIWYAKTIEYSFRSEAPFPLEETEQGLGFNRGYEAEVELSHGLTDINSLSDYTLVIYNSKIINEEILIDRELDLSVFDVNLVFTNNRDNNIIHEFDIRIIPKAGEHEFDLTDYLQNTPDKITELYSLIDYSVVITLSIPNINPEVEPLYYLNSFSLYFTLNQDIFSRLNWKNKVQPILDFIPFNPLISSSLYYHNKFFVRYDEDYASENELETIARVGGVHSNTDEYKSSGDFDIDIENGNIEELITWAELDHICQIAIDTMFPDILD
jgi:hypothetical protein